MIIYRVPRTNRKYGTFETLY